MNFDLQTIWTTYLLPWSKNIVVALLVFIIGRMVARWVSKQLAKYLLKFGLDELLVRLAQNTAYYTLIAVVLLAALNRLGVDTTSALAALGAIGLAVGLAVKDSLANFFAGVMIALFQPFKLGHYIEVAGTSGSVDEVGMFSTTLLTPDMCW